MDLNDIHKVNAEVHVPRSHNEYITVMTQSTSILNKSHLFHEPAYIVLSFNIFGASEKDSHDPLQEH